MPPKPKFSREQIVEAALAVAGEQGPEALTAREVAKRLGCSTRPIFTVFEDMDELTSETRRTAAGRIEERCRWAMEQTGNFVHSGVQIVRIALDEPNLFKLVFMTGDNLADSFDSLMASLQVPTSRYTLFVRGKFGLAEEEAKALFRHYWIFYFGVGALCATGRYTFTDEELEGMMEQDLRSMAVCAKSIAPTAIEDDETGEVA